MSATILSLYYLLDDLETMFFPMADDKRRRLVFKRSPECIFSNKNRPPKPKIHFEKLNIREIHRQFGYYRETFCKAIASPTPQPCTLEEPHPAPVLAPYKQRIIELLNENQQDMLLAKE